MQTWAAIMPHLLSLDLLVVLDAERIVRRKSVHLVGRKLGTRAQQRQCLIIPELRSFKTYVKPLISLNSVVILPPCSVTCFLALQ